MKHSPRAHCFDQAAQIPAEAWETFFSLCRKWAAIARQRRHAQEMTLAGEAPASLSPEETDPPSEAAPHSLVAGLAGD